MVNSMNRLALGFLAVCAGVIGFALVHRSAHQIRAAMAVKESEWQAATNRLAAAQAAAEALRGEVADKKERLRQGAARHGLSLALLPLLEWDASKEHSATSAELAAWAELRQRLGIGWDSSPDYVLVSKPALKQVQYRRLEGHGRASDAACDLLAISPDERSALGTALEHAREAAWAAVQRAEPAGDIVAQYTFPSLNSAFGQGLSNNFAAEVAEAIGPERGSFLLPQAWGDLKNALAVYQGTETMTLRQTVVDGEPDLICEMEYGGKVDSSPVRYARYPYGPILTFFPGGWQELAGTEGFTLPPRCRYQRN
jgi:hypothetical protein